MERRTGVLRRRDHKVTVALTMLELGKPPYLHMVNGMKYLVNLLGMKNDEISICQ